MTLVSIPTVLPICISPTSILVLSHSMVLATLKITRFKVQNSLLRATYTVMNIEWDYGYYQPWSDNEWLVDEILALLDENIMM